MTVVVVTHVLFCIAWGNGVSLRCLPFFSSLSGVGVGVLFPRADELRGFPAAGEAGGGGAADGH